MIFSAEGIFYKKKWIRWRDISSFHTEYDDRIGDNGIYYMLVSFSDGREYITIDLPPYLENADIRKYIAMFSDNPNITDFGHLT
ncbi:hypothetical protein [Chitinophaga barathri]|uniref:Uncharacterized protein n=1 Tax=Chitinophaga barathri TaxID=1647451 RepID=A0A3N4MDJ2_9BACT|nr:hypothetical protein [Chitinophaga barathri]RPD42012.1 hypothetical protein EG028_07620 [Chitinophaga barathri]